MKKYQEIKIIFIIPAVCIGIFLLLIAGIIIYDRVQLPPAPNMEIPKDYQDVRWEISAKNFLKQNPQPNSLAHYLQAFSRVSGNWNDSLSESINHILEYGWDKEYPEVTKALEYNQKAIEEVLSGARMKQCELPPSHWYISNPHPKPITLIPLSKLLGVQGAKLTKENKIHEALDVYLNGLQYGLDMGTKNQKLFMWIYGLNCINYMSRGINQAMKQPISKDDYQLIIKELSKTDKSYPDVLYSLQHTTLEDYTQSYYISKNPQKFVVEYLESTVSREVKIFMEGLVFFDRGRFLRSSYNYHQEILEKCSTQPLYLFAKTDWGNLTPNRILNRSLPTLNPSVVAISYMRVKTNLRLAEIGTAIQWYHLEKKSWPKTLDDLESYLSPVPMDPFSDKPFFWKQDKGIPVVYSVGPDSKDDKGDLLYDPTNGTLSEGDILLR